MSVDFQADTQLLRADPTASSINNDAYTITMRVYMGTDSSTTNNILNIETADSQMHQLYTDGNNTSWKIGHALKTTSATLGTGNTGEWISIAIVGAVNGSSQKVVMGYLRNASGATQSVEHVHGHQTTDELSIVLLNGWNYNSTSNGRCKVADFKMWSSALTQAQIEAEWESSAPVVTSGLICHNDFGGANIGEALSSTTSNQTGFDTWVSTDSSNNTSAVDPVWSSDNPTYASAGATLSGTVAMPSTEPTVSINVAQSAIGSIANTAASVSATFNALPTVGRPLIAFVGGWMSIATDIELSDSRGGGWTKLGLQKITASNIWLGAWVSTMQAGGSSEMTVTATPNNAAGNWITINVLEIADSYPERLVDVALTYGSGTNTAPTVDLASTTNSETLIVAAVSYVSSANSASAGTNYTLVSKKDGESALAVERRYVSSAGNYDPAFVLANSDSWIAAALALTAVDPDTPVEPPYVTSVTVSPSAAVLAGGESQRFTASVQGQGPFSSAVTWSLVQGDGMLGSSGLYTAPGVSTTAVVRATSDMTPTVFGQATIGVTVTDTPDVADGPIVRTTLRRNGNVLAGVSLDYWIISSADALITSGSDVTDSTGTFSVQIQEQYAGQSVLVVVNNLSSDMETTGRFHGQHVVIAS